MTVSRLLKNGGLMALGGLLGGTGIVALEAFLIGKIGQNDQLKDMMVETVKDMIKYAMFGEVRRSRYSAPRYYKSYAENYAKRYSRAPSYICRNIEHYRFDSRSDAFDVIDKLKKLIDQYHWISIENVNDLLGIKTIDYTDILYGWNTTDDIKVEKHKDGYGLKFPEPVKC